MAFPSLQRLRRLWRAWRGKRAAGDQAVVPGDLQTAPADLQAAYAHLTAALAASEERFQAVFDASPDATIIANYPIRNEPMRILYCNTALSRLHGVSREALLHIPAGSFAVEQFTPDTRHDLVRRLQSGETVRRESLQRRADGTTFTAEVIMTDIRIGGEHFVLSVARDITARKEAEAAMARQLRFQAALLEAIPDILLSIDADGRVAFAHVPRADLLPLPAQPVGQALAAVLPPAFAHAVEEAQARLISEGVIAPIAYSPGDTADAPTLEGRIVNFGAGEWLLIIRDVTAQHRFQRELERARDAAEETARMKTAFLSTMSHEIRTPLNAVIGMSDLLLTTDLTIEQESFAATIATGGKALLDVINNILDYSRSESGQLTLEAQPFDLHGCLSEAAQMLTREAQQKGLTLTCTLEPSVPCLAIGDVIRLRQVVLNLLANAIKFTERGAIALGACAEPLDEATICLTITVRDTGIGIAADQQERIFEAFAQGDNSTARRYGGTGLGLAISRQLVRLMGGRISVDSVPGAGATFQVVIPLPVPPNEITAAPERTSAALRPLRALIAEDNPINQEVTRRLLGRMGHMVTVVDGGQAAITAVQAAAYDVILMDIQMPDLDGEQATRAIRALGGRIHQPYIIALTANALEGDRERLMHAGFDAYLSKPVHQQGLHNALERVPGAVADIQPGHSL